MVCPSQVRSTAKHNTGRWMMKVFACAKDGKGCLKDTLITQKRIMGNFVRCSILRHNGGIYSIHSQ